MNKIYLSKSKYCRAVQCNKMLWLDKNKPEEAMDLNNESIFETGTKVGELAKGIFGKYINIEYRPNLKEMIIETENYMNEKPNIITEASFTYENNFCSVDILKNDIDGVEIYEVKSSTGITEIYLHDVAYQVYILTNLGYKVKSANIIHINNKYEKYGELELKKLFKIENVTEIALEMQDGIEEKILEINEYMSNIEEPEIPIGEHCFNPYNCAYWKYCTRNLPEKNIFDIRKMTINKKLEYHNKGMYSLEDLIDEDINQKFKEQIEYEIYDKEPKIEKEKIKEFLNELYFPLYFLDFETFKSAIPIFDGTRPYQQIPFQYSLHYIENEEGELKHKKFLAEANEDPRRKIAERLLTDIPENACILAYNMTFEKGVIENLANVFEDLRERLMKIHNNIKDLMIPFRNREYYVKEMEGSYSIKKVLPALFPDEPELDYNNLSIIHNGDEAMNIFPKLTEMTKQEQEEIRKALLEYCKLDTLAMVKIWEKLKEIK